MYKSITKLTFDMKNDLISDFLAKLGKRISRRRHIRSLSQTELADCLDIDRTTLSKYESGDRDMPVSMLPLISTYCKFPLYELFPKDESQSILDTFAKAVSIVVERKKRQEKLQNTKIRKAMAHKKDGQEKILKGQIFDVNGQEVFEPIPPKKQKSLRERYRDAEMHTEYQPFTETEFKNYVNMQKEDYIVPVMAAGQFLSQLENQPNKETLKGMVADYIVDGLVIENVAKKHPDETSRRAYAYYREIYNKYQNKQNNKVIDSYEKMD